MKLPAVCLIVVSLATTGCLGAFQEDVSDATTPVSGLTLGEIEARLTAPVYEVVERLEARLTMDDGTEIWLDVYRPGDADEPVPVIFTKTPYRGLSNALNAALADPSERSLDPSNPFGLGPASPGLAAYFIPRGYAVAYADARGTHNSDGCHDHKGSAQGEDAARVVEWLADQEWSNGKVGMIGGSYEGYTQFATAIHQPAGLATIVPAVSVHSQYGYIYYEGVPYHGQGPGTTSAYGAVGFIPPNDPAALPGYHERVLCQPENYSENLDRNGDWSDYWEARDVRPHLHRISVPVLQVHGHQDWNVKPDHIDGLFNEIRSEKRLVIGQFGHSFPTRDDWPLILHRWFDHWLHGIDTGILADLPPVLTEDSDGNWRALDAYPPRDPGTVTFWLTADGRLDLTAPEDAARAIRDYPRDSGTFVDGILEDLGEAGTSEPGFLVFESAPLDEDLHYTGRPLLELAAATDAAQTHWTADLQVVHANGDVDSINRGFLNTRHMEDVKADPVTLTPGARYEATLKLYPQDDVIPAGSTLRLVVSNDHPMVHQALTYATSQVFLGEDGARLVLPFAPEGTAVPADTLREDLAAPS